MNHTNIVSAPGVLSIDFNKLMRSGIRCVIFDIEGTLAPWDTVDIPDDILAHIKQANIPNICLVTNIDKKHAARVQIVAEKLGAKASFYPFASNQRKPSPFMLNKCLKKCDTNADQTIMIGDKLFDVLAAKRAGLSQVYWVDRLGKQDHWFDRLVYRRIEPLVKKIVIENKH